MGLSFNPNSNNAIDLMKLSQQRADKAKTPTAPTAPKGPGTVAKTSAPAVPSTTNPVVQTKLAQTKLDGDLTTDEDIESPESEENDTESLAKSDKKAPPPKTVETPEGLAYMKTIAVLNLGLKLGGNKTQALFDQGKEAAKQAFQEGLIKGSEYSKIMTAASSSPTASGHGKLAFQAAMAMNFVNNGVKEKDRTTGKSIFRDVPQSVKNTANKLFSYLQEKGELPGSKNSLQSIFAKDSESLDVINSDQIYDLLLVMQQSTDEFLERADALIADPRRKAQEKAQLALDISSAILVAEKQVTLQKLENESKFLQDRGLKFDQLA